MNFVDVQPNFSLDYAWTSPSPTAMSANKSSKTSRKQNRCCDQCRKGKRACDAAILEDALLDGEKPESTPASFHYSDVFGPLARCGNCQKTKKTCTFEWLKSQRIAQSAQPPPMTVPAAKRRRTSPFKTPGATTASTHDSSSSENHIRPDDLGYGRPNSGELELTSVEFAATFADFAGGPTAFGTGPSKIVSPAQPSILIAGVVKDSSEHATDSLVNKDPSIFDTSTLQPSVNPDPHHPSDAGSPSTITSGNSGDTPAVSVPHTRKRRRRCSVDATSNVTLPYSALSLSANMSATNNVFLRESVLKMYQYSFENALSCWVTERTCPYTTNNGNPLKSNGGPDWNHIYYRVFRLDRLAASMKGRQLTPSEEGTVTKALNHAIYAFATQWAQQSAPRNDNTFPYSTTSLSNQGEASLRDCDDGFKKERDYRRQLQIDAWNEAQNSLLNAGRIESYRVVLAHIVFALVRKPLDEVTISERMTQNNKTVNVGTSGGELVSDQEMDVCEDLMSKLDIAIEADGPPTHLEQGLRLIQSLRSRLVMAHGGHMLTHRLSRRTTRIRTPSDSFNDADRAAVDLLFWLGIMFDTLSAAINRRPLVVPDEDSDLYHTKDQEQHMSNTEAPKNDDSIDSAWDQYLFSHQDSRLHGPAVRWPCSFDHATALLCDAAPVKVLLFRKLTRIQTLITRNYRGAKIEAALSVALSVYTHWNKLYSPFIQDCIQVQDQIHPHIQSWCICLASHWHLATLLLADLVEIIDENSLGDSVACSSRLSSDFVAQFRDDNCLAISDIARNISSQERTAAAPSSDLRFSLSKDALSMEPWSTVLIRAFAKAGLIFLEADTMLPLKRSVDQGDTFERAEMCVQALWYFGRESDVALSAAVVLGNALEERRREAQERVNMSCLLDRELWHNLENFGSNFELEHLP